MKGKSVLRILTVLVIVCILTSPLLAIESLYPLGTNIYVDYRLNDTVLTEVDTIVITRTLINKESFIAEGFYWSDLLPPAFRLVAANSLYNSTLVSNQVATESNSPIAPGMTAYRWTINSPGTTGGGEIRLEPGDTIVLVAKFVCPQTGTYQLPFRSTVFYAESEGGFFATSDSRQIRIVLATDSDDDDPIRPGSYLLSLAYPNPFNATVNIDFESSTSTGALALHIYNSLGQSVHSELIEVNKSNGTLQWTPDALAGTGLYFYRLTSGDQTSVGKLVLLK